MNFRFFNIIFILLLGTNLLLSQYRRTIKVKEGVDSIALKEHLNQIQTQKLQRTNRVLAQPFFVPNPVPQDNNKESAEVSRINLIRDSGLNLQGDGMTASMWESGNAITTHSDFYDDQSPAVTRINQLGNTAVNKDHAIAVAGTIASSGKNNINAKGMAPKAKIRTYNTNYSGAFTSSYINEVKTEVLSKESILANNSWDFSSGYYQNGSTWKWGEASGAKGYGMEEDYIFGFYSAFDVETDQLLNEQEDYSIIFSAGNDRNQIGGNIIGPGGTQYPKDCASGYDCISWSHNAKNIIVVGAINETLDFEKSSDITLANFSSVGPTDDGRIKPDVVAVGTNVFSTVMPDTYLSGIIGTSFSAPVISGGSLLIQEHAKNELGTTLLGFTLKGLISNTAGELGDYIGPDYHYGWGVFDAKGAADFISNINTSTFIAEDVLSNNETKTYYFAPKLDRITATLSWYDPEGTPVFDFSTGLTDEEAQNLLLNNRTSMLVNDLDLRLENGSAEYEPWKLDVSQPSNPPLRGDNSVDNIEEVYIDTDELQESIIKVTVSHKGTLKDSLDEHFALLINGVQEINCNIYDGTSWSIKTPDGTDECLIFNGDYTISSDTTLTAPYIQIEKDMTLTVMNKSTLTINGSISNNGSLIVKPLATLKVQ